jgi:serine-type D-Ala-D-Ala carboxypeptidase/endopeptidase (penicillin-binding protein 4)
MPERICPALLQLNSALDECLHLHDGHSLMMSEDPSLSNNRGVQERWAAVRACFLLLLLSLFSYFSPALAHIKHRNQKASPSQQSPAKTPARRSASSNDLKLLVDRWLHRAELAHSLVGVEILDVNSGAELVSSMGHCRFTPASTAKIIVTACAYDKLGPKFIYKTSLVTRGEVTHDTVHGDLILLPSQDPTLDRDNLRELVSGLKAQGVNKVTGKLLLEEPLGGGERFLGEWLSEDWAQDWMPVSSSLVIDRNISSPAVFSKPRIKINHADDTDTAFLKTLLKSELTMGWLSFTKEDRTTNVYSLKDAREPATLRAVANPDTYNLALLEDMLKAAGIKIENQKLSSQNDVKNNGQTTVLSEHVSKPLAQIIRTTLHESDNLYAQQLLRTLAAESDSKSHTNNLEDRGLLIERSWLSSFGVPLEEVILWDGCGLSRKDFVSPYALTTVIRYMATHENLKPYLGLLKAGQIKPAGGIQFKTGAMDSVRGITGLLENALGQRLAFAILVNGHTTSVENLRTSLSSIISQLAQAKLDLPTGANAVKTKAVQAEEQVQPTAPPQLLKPPE